MKKMQKTLGAVLAVSMLAAGAMSASAALDISTIGSTGDYTSTSAYDAATSAEVTVTGTAKVAPAQIKATLPAQVPVVLNPGNVDNAGQIVSPKFVVTNTGNVPVSVFVNKCYTATDLGDIRLGTTPPPAGDTNQTLQLFLHPGEANSTKYMAATNVKQGDIAPRKGEPASSSPLMLLSNVPVGGTGKFVWAGSMNAQPNAPWVDKDITMSVIFTVKPV